MKHRGYEVWIECEGSKLEEYALEVKEESTSCFIASEAGKKFRIVLMNSSETTAQFRCTMDGCEDECSKEYYILDPEETWLAPGLYMNSHSVRPYIFVEPVLTDDHALVTYRGARAKGRLGTIEVRIRRVRVCETSNASRPASSAVFTSAPLISDKVTVHEESKQIGAHCVVLGGPEETEETDECEIDYLDAGAKLFAKFDFVYRPRDILRAQGIIPVSEEECIVSPTPVTHASKRSLENIAVTSGEKRPRRDSVSITQSTGTLDAAATTSDAPVPGESAEDVKPAVTMSDDNDSDDEDIGALLKSQGDAMRALQAMQEAMNNNMKALQKKMDRMNAKRAQKPSSTDRQFKREASPIMLRGISSGTVIDLSED